MMTETKMAPDESAEELRALRERVTQLEDELQRHKVASHGSAEERFHRMADAAPVMIWTAGPEALCTFFNAAWLEFRGRNLQEECGNGWADGLHPDDRDLCLETYLKSFSARQAFRIEYRLQRSDGEYRWVENTGVPNFEDGKFCGFIGSAVDVTHRKTAMVTPDEEAVRIVFSLTERERQVLVLIAEGKSTKEAAARLGISYKTADSHRSRILEKLGVHETASMVRYAIRAGLVAP
ncbi:MAG TPA: LuxR C-terminal-related transcriptional regulator [Bryobacteraceae bacterium]|nr:LuxR C-terminal-related transcriptional regulator [Bryobacteraceae bacterium]